MSILWTTVTSTPKVWYLIHTCRFGSLRKSILLSCDLLRALIVETPSPTLNYQRSPSYPFPLYQCSPLVTVEAFPCITAPVQYCSNIWPCLSLLSRQCRLSLESQLCSQLPDLIIGGKRPAAFPGCSAVNFAVVSSEDIPHLTLPLFYWSISIQNKTLTLIYCCQLMIVRAMNNSLA